MQPATAPLIPPMVGRVVLFHEFSNGTHAGPFAATVSCVHNDRCINIGYLSAEGHPKNAVSITLVQPGDVIPNRDYACWMPYQIGQAEQSAAYKRELARLQEAAKTSQRVADEMAASEPPKETASEAAPAAVGAGA